MNLLDLLARISQDTDEYEQGLDKAADKSSQLGEALKNGLAKGAKLAAAALKEATAAIGALTKTALDQYGEYEQLVGDLETLFQDSAGKARQYADEAYKTAGLSANEYMETVTGFSASLLQSLDGDTARAADLADLAIRDMADNANKMGSDMESIQSAYQEFAKQNYTALDSLKLGYGGTEEEMQRLLADAEKLSGQKFDLSSYADIVEAIHVVQTEMGITGTAAAEAATTIQGSVGAVKAAWANFITGLGDENADLGKLTDNLADSLQTAAGNIGPRLAQIFVNLGEAIAQAAPIWAAEAAALLEEVLPPLLDGGAQLLAALVSGVVSALPELLSAVPGILQAFWEALSGSMPQLAEAGGQLMEMLKTGLSQGIPQLLAVLPDVLAGLYSGFAGGLGNAITWGADLLSSLADGILGALPQLVARLPEVYDTMFNAFSDNAGRILEAGAGLLLSLIDGIVETIPQLTDQLPTVINSIVDTLTQGLPDLIDAGMEALSALIEGLMEALPELADAVPELISTIADTLTENFPKIVESGLGILLSLIDGVIDNLPNLISTAVEVIGRLASGLIDNLPKILQAGWDILSALIGGIIEAIPEIADRIPEVLDAIKNGFLEGVERLKDAGSQLLTGLWNGIWDKVDWLKEKVSGVVDRIKGWFTGKSGFDEHSPSKWAEEVGAFVSEGLAKGIDKKSGKVKKSAEQIAKDTYSTLKTWADRQSKLQELSYEEQIELWQEIQKQFKEGGEQFLQAEEKIFDLRQKLAKEQAEAEKKRQQEYEKALKERETALKEYQSKVEQIQKEMESAQEEYQKTLESRTQQIFNSYGLFDELPKKQKVSGDQLILNLRGQVNQMEQFYAGLEALEERGFGWDIADEIRQMGPKAKDQLDALLAMSDDKLKEYAGLYAEKQKLASDTATAELSGFLRETEKKIAEGNRQIKQLNDEYGPKIGLSLMDGMALGIKQGAGGLRQAMAQTMQGVYQAAMQAMSRLAGGMGLQTSVGGIKAGIAGQDILPSQGLTQGVVEFGQSALGASSASLVNSLAGAAGKAADASLTVNLNMDGRKLASALLDPLAKFAKANGTGIINAT